jgi:hypothetical protein
MASPTGTVSYAPKMGLIRVVSANDAALPTSKNAGVNLSDFDEVVLHVVLKNGATSADVQVHVWSPEAAAFLPFDPALSVTNSSGTRSILRVGRPESAFFEVTGIVGGAGERIFLELAGIPAYDEVG